MTQTQKEVAPIDPGCPHCGRMEPHPRSSPPTNPKGAVVVAKPVITVKVEPAPVAPVALPVVAPIIERASGKLAYDTWVLHVGHGDAAVSWDKLTQRAQGAWNAVARACEAETAKFMKSQPRK